jgi:hypothetical protein
MSEKIIDMVVKLVETGSTSALWFYGIYVLGSVLKFVIGFGCVLLSVTRFCAALKDICNKEEK